MSSSNGPCIRPISVMSLLADQMKCSSLTEHQKCDNEERGIPINSPYKYDEGYVSSVVSVLPRLSIAFVS